MIPRLFGLQTCGDLEEGSKREWLVADGLGGYAMGTISGLRTRRYHGLLVPSTSPPIGRQMALASLDPVLVVGDRRIRLATHEWVGGSISPTGYVHLVEFSIDSGVPSWRWALGDVLIERELAMVHGRPAVSVVHRVIRAPGPVHLELEALCTWRDVNGERFAEGNPTVDTTSDGFVFEGHYRLSGPDFRPTGDWYRGVRYRVEADRGLGDHEDLFFAGTFSADLSAGETICVNAWADDLADIPLPAEEAVAEARRRAGTIVTGAQMTGDEVGAALVLAADQFIVAGPTVVAGYPWFGDWSRDTMTSYEGLFLSTGRADEGRDLLSRAAGSLSEGMLANTADVGGTAYNTADATLWFFHALHRHLEVTGDLDLAASLLEGLREVVDHHISGTRYGIHCDSDGLLTQGEEGLALTWMDARIDGVPVTQRAGKPVEVNALWVNALACVADMTEQLGGDAGSFRALEERARSSFAARFIRPDGQGCYDVVDGPGGDDRSVRPNQLFALSLPFAPLSKDQGEFVISACGPLLTPLGLRSLSPSDPSYQPRHRGGPASRDRAYHQGTVWPWLIGPYIDTLRKGGRPTTGLLDGLVAHLGEAGLGSVSETAEGEEPHMATGCPFQAWSVAELLRVWRLEAINTLPVDE